MTDLRENVLGMPKELKVNILKKYKPDENLESAMNNRLEELNQKYN